MIEIINVIKNIIKYFLSDLNIISKNFIDIEIKKRLAKNQVAPNKKPSFFKVKKICKI